jgi:hypothetical protein
MVVKSATKKKLMDLGIADNYAHTLADDRKWDDVKILTAQQIAQICETDSETGDTIHAIINSVPNIDDINGSMGPVTNVKLKKAKKRRMTPHSQDLETYDKVKKLLSLEDTLSRDPVFKALEVAIKAAGSTRFNDRIIHDLTLRVLTPLKLQVLLLRNQLVNQVRR